MRGFDALPLLFAMRVVAHYWGWNTQYWPEFTTYVLNGRVDLGYVRAYIAHDLRVAWVQLYRETGGSLYFPRVGLANLKWPLAHAGLLHEDVEILRQYGESVLSGQDSLFLLGGEVEVLLTDLASWLVTHPELSNTTLARTVCGAEETTALTVAELAQAWLRSHLAEIGSSVISTPVRSTSNRPPSVSLRWDDSREQLGLAFGPSRWSGRKSISAQWGAEHVHLPTAYDFVRDETKTEPCFVPATSARWASAVRFTVGDTRHDLRVPPSPFPGDGVLIARQSTGNVTRRWEPDEPYFLIGSEAALRAGWATTLFGEASRIGAPRGEWGSILVFAAGSRMPLHGVPEAERRRLMAALSEQVEAAHVQLTVPPLAELIRPRVSLIGGVETRSATLPRAFLASQPPLLRLTGWKPDSVLVRLERWDVSRRAYRAVDEGRVEPPPDGSTRLIQVNWPELDVRAGYYRVLLDGFEASSLALAEQAQAGLTRMNFSLDVDQQEFIAGSGVSERVYPRDVLETCEFVVGAVPEAEIRLRIEANGMVVQRFRTADDTGALRLRLKDLDLNVPPAKDVRLRAYCGLFGSAPLEFTVGPGTRRSTLHIDAGPTGLSFSVQAKNAPEGATARLLVIGTAPWRGSFWEGTASVQNGWLFGTVPSAVSQGWIAVVGACTGSDSFPWLFEPFGDPRITPPAVKEVVSEGWGRWSRIAEELGLLSHPASFERLLVYTWSGDLLAALSDEGSCAWIPVSTQALALRKQLQPEGFVAPIGLFGSVARFPVRATSSEFNLPIIRADEHSGALRFRAKQLRSFLSLRGTSPDEWVLHTREPLNYCSNCGFLVPVLDWDNHTPLGARRLLDCKGQHLLRNDSEFSIRLAIRWDDRSAIGSTLRTLIHLIQTGGGLADGHPLLPIVRDISSVWNAQRIASPPDRWLMDILEAIRWAQRSAGSEGALLQGDGPDTRVEGLSHAIRALRRHVSRDALCEP